MPKKNTVKFPSKATLKRYGLSMKEWKAILRTQGGVCPICENFPKSGRFVTDHEHVPKWKSKKPEERKKYVRGITCWFCNRYLLVRGMSVLKAKNIIKYLEKYVT